MNDVKGDLQNEFKLAGSPFVLQCIRNDLHTYYYCSTKGQERRLAWMFWVRAILIGIKSLSFPKRMLRKHNEVRTSV